MNYLKKVWFWIGTVFVVFGAIGIIIGVFSAGLNEPSAPNGAIIEGSIVSLIFGIVAFMVGGEFSEEKLPPDEEKSNEEPKVVAK